ncbi:MAG: HipA N-terminal domain-containing protein [Bacteroidia bacterium]|tara:strand:- start:2880 stop:3191 length:312 start_codon:yes stop_codon:yes gene_type:complete
MRSALIYRNDILAGKLIEGEYGYVFAYDDAYMHDGNMPVSLTLPLSDKAYTSNVLFPFFDGLIPEGWLLDIAQQNWKLNERDRFGLLLACCRDCIGAVSVVES